MDLTHSCSSNYWLHQHIYWTSPHNLKFVYVGGYFLGFNQVEAMAHGVHQSCLIKICLMHRILIKDLFQTTKNIFMINKNFPLWFSSLMVTFYWYFWPLNSDLLKETIIHWWNKFLWKWRLCSVLVAEATSWESMYLSCLI